LGYYVIASAPPLWGFLVLPAWILFLILLSGIAAARFCSLAAGNQGRRHTAIRWLLLAYVVPLLDALRTAGASIPHTFLEPLLLVFVAGAVGREIVRVQPRGDGPNAHDDRIWLLVTTLLAALAIAWWYYQGQGAYDDYLLGYHDFGHFARRVVNTWEGRGFLKETPGTPAFWDHFNPGLALLAPLWGLWPNAKLFVLLQAICLALPAPILFAIVRAWGGSPRAAACWAAAYLAFPVVGQLNLNYSYGWHPVSLALPLIFFSIWALLVRRYAVAALAAVLACSFKETVLVTMGCLTAVLAVGAWLEKRRTHPSKGQSAWDSLQRIVGTRHVVATLARAWASVGNHGLATVATKAKPKAKLPRPLSARLSMWSWLAVWALITIAFVLIYKLTPFAQFQTARFDNLGSTAVEIGLSPLLRPRAFWGQVLRAESLLFLLTLLAPLGLGTLRRGWLILSAAALPILVLLAWEHLPATCIAFQYVTTLVPVFFVAAVSGGAARGDAASAQGGSSCSGGLLTSGASALAACLTASVFFGALPWSSPTLAVMKARSYLRDGERFPSNPRAVGTPGNEQLNAIVNKFNRPEFAVLASGRLAAHLLRVRRLESVEQAIVRWDDLSDEAGPGRSGIEVFDCVVLDRYEAFQQSADKMQFIAAEAANAGYQATSGGDGILVLYRPGERPVSDVGP
jgi:uncharacterized membrane protein